MSDEHAKAVTVIERRDVERLHPMLRKAELAGVDTATIREMMTLQREWEAGEAKREYTAAIVALKRDLPTVIRKDKTVDFKNKEGRRTYYTHTSLAGVMDAVTECLTSHGFSLGWEPSTDKGQVTVTCRLTHAGGHSESSTISAPIDVSGNKSPAQGVASTITLLSRYTALALLGIATADMTEPRGESDPNAVNSKSNLAMVSSLRRAGKSLADACELTTRPVDQWTAADLAKLAAWIAPPGQERGVEVIEAEVVTDEESRNEPADVPIPEKLQKAAAALGLKGWQIAATIEECGSEDVALDKLRKEYAAKHPKEK